MKVYVWIDYPGNKADMIGWVSCAFFSLYECSFLQAPKSDKTWLVNDYKQTTNFSWKSSLKIQTFTYSRPPDSLCVKYSLCHEKVSCLHSVLNLHFQLSFVLFSCFPEILSLSPHCFHLTHSLMYLKSASLFVLCQIIESFVFPFLYSTCPESSGHLFDILFF